MSKPTPVSAQPLDEAPRHRPLTMWWPISFGVASFLFYVIGGSLIGSACGDYSCSAGQSAGGVALCCIGAVCTLTWIILLVIFLTRRDRTIHWNAATGLLDSRNFAPQQQQQHTQCVSQVAAEQEKPVLVAHAPDALPDATFCGQCGTTVTTPFSRKCGNRI